MDLLRLPATNTLEVSREHRDVRLFEGEFVVKNLTGYQELYDVYSLRHSIFAEELRWVPVNEDGLEKDHYDEQAVHFGVLDCHSNLMAYMRLLVTTGPFMMENEFSFLVGPDHNIRRDTDTIEISRLCIAHDARNRTIHGNFGVHSTSILLLKGIYQWCLANGVNYMYAVTEEKVHRLFRAKGFPFASIGETVEMPDGVKAVAIMLDWREFASLNMRKRPAFYMWFNRVQSVPYLMQWL